MCLHTSLQKPGSLGNNKMVRKAPGPDTIAIGRRPVDRGPTIRLLLKPLNLAEMVPRILFASLIYQAVSKLYQLRDPHHLPGHFAGAAPVRVAIL